VTPSGQTPPPPPPQTPSKFSPPPLRGIAPSTGDSYANHHRPFFIHFMLLDAIVVALFMAAENQKTALKKVQTPGFQAYFSQALSRVVFPGIIHTYAVA